MSYWRSDTLRGIRGSKYGNEVLSAELRVSVTFGLWADKPNDNLPIQGKKQWRANGNPNPCTDPDEILHAYPHLSKEGFVRPPLPSPSGPGGPETQKSLEHIFENCLQNKRCSAGCKLTRASAMLNIKINENRANGGRWLNFSPKLSLLITLMTFVFF